MKEALKLALEALEWCHGGEPCGTAEAITAIKKALTQQEQGRPVAMLDEGVYPLYTQTETGCAECGIGGGHALYCVACAEVALKNWVGLTDEEILGYGEGFNDACKRQPEQDAAAFIAAEDRKVASRYGYVPKLHPSEWQDAQPERPWVGLTDEECMDAYDLFMGNIERARAVEAKLREKNS